MVHAPGEKALPDLYDGGIRILTQFGTRDQEPGEELTVVEVSLLDSVMRVWGKVLQVQKVAANMLGSRVPFLAKLYAAAIHKEVV